MQILGREVYAAHIPKNDAVLVGLGLRNDDCPEGKNKYGINLCDGECQGLYFSMILNGGDVNLVGGITKDLFCGHIDDKICHIRGYGATPAEHAALCKSIFSLYKTEIEKKIPDGARAMFEHFYTQLNNEKNMPKCAIDFSNKTISVENRDLRTIDVYVNGDRLIELSHSCRFLTHYTMAKIRAAETETIKSKINEIKGICTSYGAVV